MSSILPSSVSFLSSWDSDSKQGGWQYIQEASPSGIAIDPALTTPDGHKAVKVTVNSSDIIYGGQRAEVAGMLGSNGQPLSENPSSRTEYYAVSYRFPTTWQGTEISGDPNSWSIILQLHGPDSLSSSPAFALHAAKQTNGGPEHYFISLLGGQVGKPSTVYQFTADAQITPNQWTDFVIGISYSSTPTGSIEIWRRDEGQTNFTQVLDVQNVPTLQYAAGQPVGNHYWKEGLYRGSDSTGTSSFDFGPMARGTSFDAVVSAAFGAPAPAPGTPSTVPADVLVLHLSEDAYKGDAKFIAKIDGKQINQPTSVTALRSLGEIQDFTFTGMWGAGPHQVEVDFTNDAYGGRAGLDRNLFVGQPTWNGVTESFSITKLASNGSVSFVLGDVVSS